MKIVDVNGQTHIGGRDNNEDRFFHDEEHGLFAVIDGMGGHASGELASALAHDELAYNGSSGVKSGEDIQEFIQALHLKTIELGKEPDNRGMGATIVAALLVEDELQVVWAGDSRCYQLRGGELTLLTTDHNMYEALKETLGEEAADQMRRKAPLLASRILMCLGGGYNEPIEPWLRSFKVEPGDIYLLCSDGVSDQMDDPTLAQCLGGGDPCGELEREALKKEAWSDNVTSVVFRIE